MPDGTRPGRDWRRNQISPNCPHGAPPCKACARLRATNNAYGMIYRRRPKPVEPTARIGSGLLGEPLYVAAGGW